MSINASYETKYELFRRLLLSRRERFIRILSGSFFELPLQYYLHEPTDVDAMFVDNDISVLLESNSLSYTHGRLNEVRVVVTTEGCHIGFARLRIVKTPYKDRGSGYFRPPEQWKNVQANGPCYSRFIKVLSSSWSTVVVSIIRQINPNCCETFQHPLKFDHVYAICCPSWPGAASEWKTRKRENGWPSVDVIDKIILSGCHLVSKAHQSNPTDDTQWRFSFSQAELILIQHWTHVQKYIYHILRLIKSEIVKACGGENETVLCTYFFKTLMLWSCEEKPLEFWKEENIETAVGELLCIMTEWLIEKQCSNYFIPENNMLDYLTDKQDLSAEISLLLIYRTQYLKVSFVNVVPLINENSTVGVELPKELIELLILQYLHVLFMSSGGRHTTISNILSKSNCFLPELRHLFDFLTADESLQERRLIFRPCEDWLSFRNLDSTNNCSALPFNCFFRRSPSEMIEDLCNFIEENYETSRTRNETDTFGKFQKTTLGSNTSDILKRLTEGWKSPSYILSSAYLANFLLTTLNDCRSALKQCRLAFDYLRNLESQGILFGAELFSEALCMPLTNEWSAIFDRHIQTVHGFLTLSSAVRTGQCRAVLAWIFPGAFLEYIAFQSSRHPVIDESVVFYCNFAESERREVRGNSGMVTVCDAILMAAISASGIKPSRDGDLLTACHFSTRQ